MGRGSGSSSRRPTVTKAPLGSPKTAAKRIIADDDDVLVMSPKAEKKNGSSVGKAGAVDMGVTRPKRRLSRPLSASSTPETPPDGHAGSSYQVLHRGIAGAASAALQKMQTSPRPDEKMPFAGGLSKEPKTGSPTLWGIELKWISLITLALQNAFLTIIMHYSRISTPPNRTYSASSAVLLNELLKGSISVIIALKRIDAQQTRSFAASWSEKAPITNQRRPSSFLPSFFHPTRLRVLSRELFSKDCYKLSIPAILYVIQNNLQYVAASNLDVATFQVTYQMKILTTAFFSVLMLRKRLSRTKWAALILLALGVAIVQMQSTAAPSHTASHITIDKVTGSLRSDTPQEPIEAITRVMHPLRGFIAVTMACMTSGLAGVYFEVILKASPSAGPAPDLWVRNTQLSLFSLVPALVPILFSKGGPEGAGFIVNITSKFQNFNGWAMGTVLTQTFGGLITAVVIRYSDNIMKGFATSLSIIISFLASVILFSYPITAAFLIGSSLVLASTYLYNSTAAAPPAARTSIAVAPGSPILTSAPILGEPEPPSRTSSVINLLGLGSASSSRRTSASDLRAQAATLGFTQVSPSPMQSPHVNGNGNHVYPASAPGTPYTSSSGRPSCTNLYDQNREDYITGRGYGYSPAVNGSSGSTSPSPGLNVVPPPRRKIQRETSPTDGKGMNGLNHNAKG